MLRQTILLLFLLLTAFLSHAQWIDSLHTDEQLLTFIGKVDNEVGKVSIVAPKPYEETPYMINKIKQFSFSPFEKVDFDNNGYTDLLFNGFCDDGSTNRSCRRISMVVLSFGADSFQVKNLTNNHTDCFAAKTIMIKNKSCIKALRINYIYNVEKDDIRYTEKTDTLHYVFGDFVELAPPGNYTIEKIKFCILALGSYTITITDDSAKLESSKGIVAYDALDSGGVYTAGIDSITLNRIKGLLQYMRFPELHEEYNVRWRSHVSGYTRITYNHGKVKKIEDNGILGTYGLRALYEIFFELRHMPIWKLVTPGEDYPIFCNPNN